MIFTSETTGWYWSDEILLFKEQLESVYITKQIKYIGKPIFKDYVETLYSTRYNENIHDPFL